MSSRVIGALFCYTAGVLLICEAVMLYGGWWRIALGLAFTALGSIRGFVLVKSGQGM